MIKIRDNPAIVTRRSFLIGALAAPAVIAVNRLMPVATILPADYARIRLPNKYLITAADEVEIVGPFLSMEDVAREAVKIFRETNAFLANLDR